MILLYRCLFAVVAGVAAAILLAGMGAAAYTPVAKPFEAMCDTDTDCLRFCPSYADDPDCDGGPYSTAPHGRGNYGSQP